MGFGLKHFNKPTPKKIKKIGNAISGFLASISVGSYFSDHAGMATFVALLAGAIDKIIIPLFGEEDGNQE